jgi:hypothetical protein
MQVLDRADRLRSLRRWWYRTPLVLLVLLATASFTAAFGEAILELFSP